MDERIDIDGRPAGAGTLLGGYGHFTAMQVRDGRTRGLALHLQRLDAATRELFGEPLEGDLVRDRIRHALGTDVRDASVRVYVLDADAGVSTVVTVRPPAPSPPSPQGLHAVPYLRPVAHLKHASGFAQEYYRRQAQRKGFDEALLTGDGGVVAEGGITNVGFVDGSTAVWPDAPALAGITMQLLERRIPSRRATVRLRDLPSFDGMFVTNSHGVAAVDRVDDLAVPVAHTFMATLRQAYDDVPWDRI
jgi:branched-subunit amino acid aminotransferase/4-amino-4-deoxychorismate lyase